MNIGYTVNTADMNLVFALAGLRDVVSGLHPHKRAHLHAEGFLDAERHVSGQVRLAIEKAGQHRTGNLKHFAASVTDTAAGATISVRMKSPGCGGFFIGMTTTITVESNSPRARQMS